MFFGIVFFFDNVLEVFDDFVVSLSYGCIVGCDFCDYFNNVFEEGWVVF